MAENPLDARFGTWRGLARLGLAWPQMVFAGDTLPRYDRQGVTRLVFVCHGNICRSAYGDMLARKLGANSVSFGLSTATGKPAHPPIAELGAARGLDVDNHRTSQPQDIAPLPGDLLLAMEMRHATALKKHAIWGDTPRTLLGLYTRPPVPHLHDPYKLSPAYMARCVERIEQAVAGLIAAHPNVMRGE
ncbi:arsenate reductase/protein-tyrosine-phosphatase family protein [Altererythrobacter sp. CAU 1778]